MTNEEMAIELTNHNDRLEVVEKGISNFRSFQSKMNQRVGFVYGVTWAAGIVGVIFMAFLAWGLTLVVPAAKMVINDYYRNHPAAALHASTDTAHGSPERKPPSATDTK